MMRLIGALALSLVLCGPGTAQDCPDTASIGNFEVVFEGSVFDGDATTFTYCVTGIDNPGFHALSNWMLELDPACLAEDDLVGCSPEECFYQSDDPHHGIDGVKWESDVEAGETVCYDFALDGDWSQFQGTTTLGIKAAGDVDAGMICGPVCCESRLKIDEHPGHPTPMVGVHLRHGISSIVTTMVEYRLLDAESRVIDQFVDGPVTFEPGTVYRRFFPVPGYESLEPGAYVMRARLLGMNGYSQISAGFEVPAEE